MDAIQKGTLALIKAAITGKACKLPDDFQIEQAADMIRRHKITGLAYEGAVKCGIDKQCSTMQEMFQRYYGDIVRHEQQMQLLKKIEAAFQENGIDYLPLKGTILKLLYPNPAARVMGDADILIREEQNDKIKPVMEQLGFQEGAVSDHERHWHHPQLHLELHRWIVPKSSIDLYRYYENCWEKAIPLSGSRYTFRAEDHFIFLFVHYAKHYRGGGIGLRQLVDLWVYQQANPHMDMGYIRSELSKLKIEVFFDNTQRMLTTWFDEDCPDDITAFMSDYIWHSGSWGSLEHHQTAEGIAAEKTAGSRTASRLAYLCQVIFPPVSLLKNRYPVLEKAPWLLPLMWPVRWIGALFFRHKNINNYATILKNRSADKTSAYLQELQYVGLDFDF